MRGEELVSEDMKPHGESLDKIIGVAQRRLDGASSAEHSQEQLRLLLDQLDDRKKGADVRRWLSRIAPAVALAAAIALVFSLRRHPSLALEVVHGTLATT